MSEKIKTLSIQQAAELSGFTPLLIRSWIINNKVDWGIATKIGGDYHRYVVFKKPFESWLESVSSE